MKRQTKDVWKHTEKKRERLKGAYIMAKFGRKMNEDVNGHRKMFWKEVSNAKGGRLESWSRI